jgi:hypothetical protein
LSVETGTPFIVWRNGRVMNLNPTKTKPKRRRRAAP